MSAVHNLTHHNNDQLLLRQSVMTGHYDGNTDCKLSISITDMTLTNLTKPLSCSALWHIIRLYFVR